MINCSSCCRGNNSGVDLRARRSSTTDCRRLVPGNGQPRFLWWLATRLMLVWMGLCPEQTLILMRVCRVPEHNAIQPCQISPGAVYQMISISAPKEFQIFFFSLILFHCVSLIFLSSLICLQFTIRRVERFFRYVLPISEENLGYFCFQSFLPWPSLGKRKRSIKWRERAVARQKV